MKQYIKHLVFGFLLFTIVNGAQEPDCQDRLATCLQDANKDFNFEDRPGDSLTTMLQKIEKVDYCQAYRSILQCNASLTTECAAQVRRQVTEIFDMVRKQFRCDLPEAGKCVKKINNCALDAFRVSGITLDDISKIEKPTLAALATPIDLITKIGGGKAFKFVLDYKYCAKATKNECEAIPLLHTTLDQLEVALNSNKLECK